MKATNWFLDYESDARSSGNSQRQQLGRLHREAYTHREKDPDQALSLLAEGRRLARELREPWWELFYNQEYVHALLHFKQDYRDVLSLAVANVLEVRKPSFQAFPNRLLIHGDLVAAYLGIDPRGHAEAIREACDYLDKETPPLCSERYLLLGNQRQFALELNLLDEAEELTLRSLHLASTDPDGSQAEHFSVFAFSALCEIAWKRGNTEQLLDSAQAGGELAREVGHQVEQAGFLMWVALCKRRRGQMETAKKLHTAAAGRLSRLGMPADPSYRDAQCAFHEEAGDLQAALAVREAELEAIRDRGRLAYECELWIKLLWLRRRSGMMIGGTLIDEARRAANRLRRPDEALLRIERIERGESP